MKNKLLVLTYCVASLAMTASVWAGKTSYQTLKFSGSIAKPKYDCVISGAVEGALAASTNYRTLTSDANFSGGIADSTGRATPKPASVVVTIEPWVKSVAVRVSRPMFTAVPNGDDKFNYFLSTWLTGEGDSEPRGKKRVHKFTKAGETATKTYEVHFEAKRKFDVAGLIRNGKYASIVLFTCE